MFAHLNPHSSDFGDICEVYTPFSHHLTMCVAHASYGRVEATVGVGAIIWGFSVAITKGGGVQSQLLKENMAMHRAPHSPPSLPQVQGPHCPQGRSNPPTQGRGLPLGPFAHLPVAPWGSSLSHTPPLHSPRSASPARPPNGPPRRGPRARECAPRPPSVAHLPGLVPRMSLPEGRASPLPNPASPRICTRGWCPPSGLRAPPRHGAPPPPPLQPRAPRFLAQRRTRANTHRSLRLSPQGTGHPPQQQSNSNSNRVLCSRLNPATCLESQWGPGWHFGKCEENFLQYVRALQTWRVNLREIS